MSEIITRSRTNIRQANTVRITVSIPAVIDMFLKKQIPKRQVSQFVSEAISEKIPEVIAKKKKLHPLEEFFELRKKYKSKMTNEEIIAAIHKGRK
jgi:transcriptional regulator of met regulon